MSFQAFVGDTPERHMTMRERAHAPQEKRMGCVYGSGRGYPVEGMINRAYWEGIPYEVVKAGIPLFTSHWMDSRHWGCPSWITALDSDLDVFEDEGASTERVLLLGVSMGGFLLNWARQNQERVAAFLGLTPAVNLEANHAVPAYATEINAAYGSSGAAIAAYPTHSPIEYAAELDFPIRIYGSTDDSSVDYGDLEDFVADAPDAELVSLGAVGHSVTGIDRKAASDWLTSHYEA